MCVYACTVCVCVYIIKLQPKSNIVDTFVVHTVWADCYHGKIQIYTALQKFGNTLESGVLDNIGMNPF